MSFGGCFSVRVVEKVFDGFRQPQYNGPFYPAYKQIKSGKNLRLGPGQANALAADIQSAAEARQSSVYAATGNIIPLPNISVVDQGYGERTSTSSLSQQHIQLVAPLQPAISSSGVTATYLTRSIVDGASVSVYPIPKIGPFAAEAIFTVIAAGFVIAVLTNLDAISSGIDFMHDWGADFTFSLPLPPEGQPGWELQMYNNDGTGFGFVQIPDPNAFGVLDLVNYD